MEQYQASEGAIEAHDALLAVISECYKQRKNSKYLQLGQEYDTAYSALFAASREKVLSKSPKAEFKAQDLCSFLPCAAMQAVSMPP